MILCLVYLVRCEVAVNADCSERHPGLSVPEIDMGRPSGTTRLQFDNEAELQLFSKYAVRTG
jgi:hypothetical protein